MLMYPCTYVIWRCNLEMSCGGKTVVMWRCNKVMVYGGVIWCHMEV